MKKECLCHFFAAKYFLCFPLWRGKGWTVVKIYRKCVCGSWSKWSGGESKVGAMLVMGNSRLFQIYGLISDFWISLDYSRHVRIRKKAVVRKEGIRHVRRSLEPYQRVLEIPLISLPVCLKTSFQLESGKSLGWTWLLVKKRMQNICCLHQIIPYINASIIISSAHNVNVRHLILLSHAAI